MVVPAGRNTESDTFRQYQIFFQRPWEIDIQTLPNAGLCVQVFQATKSGTDICCGFYIVIDIDPGVLLAKRDRGIEAVSPGFVLEVHMSVVMDGDSSVHLQRIMYAEPCPLFYHKLSVHNQLVTVDRTLKSKCDACRDIDFSVPVVDLQIPGNRQILFDNESSFIRDFVIVVISAFFICLAADLFEPFKPHGKPEQSPFAFRMSNEFISGCQPFQILFRSRFSSNPDLAESAVTSFVSQNHSGLCSIILSYIDIALVFQCSADGKLCVVQSQITSVFECHTCRDCQAAVPIVAWLVLNVEIGTVCDRHITLYDPRETHENAGTDTFRDLYN